ncbi:MAG TPA: hypothetical protein HPQ04_13165 [Rhodospirillaceae bacterium]|nr:hypothetical protein [Rhodospirillaceae bacterium]
MARLTELLARLPINPELIPRLQDRWQALLAGRVGQFVLPWIEKARQVGLLASKTSFVLTIGDEGATLVEFRGHEAVDAVFVGPDAEEGPETFRAMLEQDPQAKVLVSADSLEQMYREEQMPKVGRLDRRNVVKRRLDVAFPHDRLRAAVPLDRSQGGAGGTLLFTALPVTPQLEPWITFLESLPNPIHGFCLLPLESAELAAKLAPSSVGDERRVWHALVTQQATSGFRQIFESGGHLAVTRLTQRPPGEMTAAQTAMLIERELRSSISYVKRLGYTDFDRLDLVVLADPEVCEAVAGRELPVTSLTVHSPRTAGELLGFGTVGPEDSPYADALHACLLANKRRPTVILPTEKFSARLRTDELFRAGFVTAAALTFFTLLYIGSMVFDAFDTLTTAEVLEKQVANEQQSLNLSKKKVQGFAIPVDDLVMVIKTAQSLTRQQVNPTGVLRLLARALGPVIRVQSVSVTTPPPVAAQPSGAGRGGFGGLGIGGREAETLYELKVTARLTGDSSQPEALVQQAKDLKDRISRLLPDHEISITQMPLSQIRTQILEGSAGTASAAIQSGPPTADYLIRKRL